MVRVAVAQVDDYKRADREPLQAVEVGACMSVMYITGEVLVGCLLPLVPPLLLTLTRPNLLAQTSLFLHLHCLRLTLVHWTAGTAGTVVL